MKRIVFILVIVFCFIPLSYGQSRSSLDEAFPILTKKINLQGQRADYIFVIDQSGTMYKYKQDVGYALREFFYSLQDNDYVSIIKFGLKSTNEPNSCGEINNEMRNVLSGYIENLYTKPERGSSEYRDYYATTDIYQMMSYLDKDLQRTEGRHPMKFVFLVSDFVHETGAADWKAMKSEFEKHHKDKNVKVFILQLPQQSSGEVVYDKVNEVLSSFDVVPTRLEYLSGAALSEWFTQRKDDIQLDRLKQVVKGNIKDIDLQLSPAIDINGNAEIAVRWSPNNLFESIRISNLAVDDEDWEILGFQPTTISTSSMVLPESKIAYKKASFFAPFRRINANITATFAYNDSLMSEMEKLLGNDAPIEPSSSFKLNRMLFCYSLPLGWCVVILLIVLAYIILVIHANRRNHNTTISGRFSVTHDVQTIAGPVAIQPLKQIAIGQEGRQIIIPNCQWRVSIFVQTKNPFLHPFNKPAIKIRLEQGQGYRVNGRNYTNLQQAKITRYTNFDVDGYRIIWNR